MAEGAGCSRVSEPFEQKFKQVKMNLTALKIRNDELRNMINNLTRERNDLYYQVRLAHSALIKAGWRRLEDMSWTDEPFQDDQQT